MSEESVEKYRIWIAELEKRKAKNEIEKKRVYWLLIGLVVTTPIAAHWGPYAAVFCGFFWVLLFGASIYLTIVHGWEYDRQLEQAEEELQDILEPPSRPKKRPR